MFGIYTHVCAIQACESDIEEMHVYRFSVTDESDCICIELLGIVHTYMLVGVNA